MLDSGVVATVVVIFSTSLRRTIDRMVSLSLSLSGSLRTISDKAFLGGLISLHKLLQSDNKQQPFRRSKYHLTSENDDATSVPLRWSLTVGTDTTQGELRSNQVSAKSVGGELERTIERLGLPTWTQTKLGHCSLTCANATSERTSREKAATAKTAKGMPFASAVVAVAASIQTAATSTRIAKLLSGAQVC